MLGNEIKTMQDLDRQITQNIPSSDPARHNDEHEEEDQDPSPFLGLTRGRVVVVLCVLLTLVLMAVIPPLINVGRYRRRIANSIGLSLGRAVHIDSVTLNILPMPGFTLENFVVQDDPAFSAEPVIRAQQVRATLRISSLWRRRVEFSRIALDDPSVNLVHLPNGQWNLESILLQASRMPAAPTQQKGSGQTPRFPYIEATGGRVNIKMGLEKMPISLTDAGFALWLPEPHQWHLRLKATPARTDAASTDTGLIRVEGTLGQAPTLADVPIDLTGRWTAAPLGAVSRLLMGRDAGMRGQMTLATTVHGTMSANQIQSRLELRGLRRADFVPDTPIDADIACTAAAAQLFHSLNQLTCTWPPDVSAAPNTGLTLTGSLPDVFHPSTALLNGQLSDLPAAALLHAARVWNQRISPTLQATGTLDGNFTCCTAAPSTPSLPFIPAGRHSQPSPVPALPSGPLSGTLTLKHARLTAATPPPFVDATNLSGTLSGPQLPHAQLTLLSIPLNLGGKDPALLDLHADTSGYSLHLSGTVLPSRWAQLINALPPLGDGVKATPLVPPPTHPVPALAPATTTLAPVPDLPIHIDLTAHRLWGSTQLWSVTTPAKAPTIPSPRHKKPPSF